MTLWQSLVIFIYLCLNLVVFGKGFYECKYKKNAFGLCNFFCFLGMFVWGDAVIFGLFWILVSLFSLILHQWYIFLSAISIFWVVRSLGETIYWFNQQFSAKGFAWNKPEKLFLHAIFHDESIWFVYQIIWQCVCVVAILTTIYLVHVWFR